MSETIVRERIIQMDWVCNACKGRNKGLEGEGDGLTCPLCGKPKDVEQYLMPDDTYTAPTVTDSRLLELAYAGENQKCKKCSVEVRAKEKRCQNCGADMEDEAAENASFSPPPSAPRPPASHDVSCPPLMKDEEEQRFAQRVRGDSGKSSAASCVAIAGALVLIISLFVWLLAPHKTVATVNAVSWTYIEHLEQRSTQHGSGWGSPGSDAFNVACEMKQKGTERCHPHDCNCHDKKYDCNCTGGDSYKCNPHQVDYSCNCTGGDTYECNCRDKEKCVLLKNGAAKCTTKRTCDTCTRPRKCGTCQKTEYDTCTHPVKCDTCTKNVCDTCYDQCPVYDNWCEYDYYQWSVVRREPTSGTDLNVHWYGLEARGGEQRVIREKEEYSVTLTDGSRSWTDNPASLTEFQRFPPGKRFLVEYTYLGTHTVISPVD